MSKYIFVTGGVVSGLGKGITAASLGRFLKSRGLKVAAQKLDPYINVDPGTMSPDGRLVETVELTDRDFYVGVQYHPEFKSRPNKPHPLFLGFIGAAFKNRKA